MEVQFREATFDDLPEVVSVHSVCFKRYFLTSLGSSLLYRFYERFLMENKDLFIVAVVENHIIGFVMGYFTGSQARADFEKKHKLRLAFRLFWLCLTLNKEAFLRIRLKILRFFQKKKRAIISVTDPKEATLLSICMLPEYQGGGRAAEMVTEFEKKLLKNNKHIYVLSVKNYNTRGIRFYEKLGFSVHQTTTTETTFIKNI